jgi:hypothetical protein
MSYNTNLAAEYYVMSVLHRLGIEAYLTVGNKKTVDILVRHKDGTTSTVDVKGLAGTTSWYAMNCDRKEGHYIVLVSFLGRIHDPSVLPEVYVVPSTDLGRFLYRNPKETHEVVPLGRMHRPDGTQFRDNWKPLLR